MKRLFLILIITLPSIVFGQDLKHWFSSEFEEASADLIPQNKIALVIGNKDYEEDNFDLKNPINDVRLMDSTLKQLGFKVTLKENLNKDQFLNEIIEFKDKQDKHDFSIIYYAGHAIQDDNGNSYIIPVDFSNKNQIEDNAFNISEILNYFENSEKQCLLILDACRTANNNGLRKPSIEDPLNVKLAYSTSYGRTASDNEDMNNTIYTRALSWLFLQEGLSIYEILHNTSKYVRKRTDKQQYPVHYFGDPIENIILIKSE